MKVKALTNINFGSGWKKPGEIFDIKDEDFKGLNGVVEAVGGKPAAKAKPEVKQEKIPEEPVPEEPIQEEPAEPAADPIAETPAEKPKTTRRRKA